MHFGVPHRIEPEIVWKIPGLLAFGAYFWIHPPFLDWEAIVAYLALTLGAGLLAEYAVAPALERPGLAPPHDGAPGDGCRHLKFKARPWRDTLLALGEDGLCFVPLLLVGANPITAEVVAVASAALHFPAYPLKHCVWKGLHVFFVAIVVLPYGLGSIAIGHLIARALAYRFGNLVFLRPVVAVGGGRSSIANVAPPESPHPEAPR